MKDRKKILVFYVDKSSGHKFVADAIIEKLVSLSKNLEINNIVLLEHFPLIKFTKYFSMKFINFFPHIWHLLHGLKLARKIVDIIRPILAHIFFKKILKNTLKEDALLLLTHAFPTYLLSYFKKVKKINSKIYTVITDYYAHPYWINKEVDMFFVPTKEVATQLLRENIHPQNIKITGIPIRESILKTHNKVEARKMLDIDIDKQTILLLGGSCGIIEYDKILNQIISFKDYQFVVVCGKNNRYFMKLKRKYNNQNIYIFGFTDKVSLLLDAADIVITKPGAVSITEIISKRKPFIFLQKIYAQEKKNELFLIKNKYGVRCKRIKDLPYIIARLPETTNFKPIEPNNAAALCASYLLY